MLTNPRYTAARPITIDNTANIAGPNRDLTDAIYCGGAGIAQVVLQDDTVVPFTVVAGQILPVAAKRVNSTSTTASLLVALYQL